MAIKKACIVADGVRNTGKECDISMGPTAMLIPIDANVSFTETDLEDPVDWLNTLIHQKKAFPLFGQKAPIRAIDNNAEADVMVTLDDGSTVFVRYGMYNRTFQTTSGGLCYAKALKSLLNSGKNIIEIDKQGQMLVRKNSDDTMSGLIVDNMYSPSPILGNLRDVYRNQFKYTLDPTEMVDNGVVMEGAEALLSMMGLIDTKITSAAAASVTKLKIAVATDCAETDLVALIGANLADPTNFLVKNKATGAEISITGAAIVAGIIELTGTFVSASTYTVTGTSPAIWLGNDVEGYDGTTSTVEITIP